MGRFPWARISGMVCLAAAAVFVLDGRWQEATFFLVAATANLVLDRLDRPPR